MEKIEFINLSLGGKCDLFHHGEPVDFLEKFNLMMHKKMVYGIIGEFGNGGAAFSCGITGHTNYYEGSVYIDNNISSIENVINSSWYIGYDIRRSKIFGRKQNTVKQQIENGLDMYHKNMRFEDIRHIFGLSNERSNRNIEYASGERFKLSSAIGFAYGKKIFCYPWLNTKDINTFGKQINKTINALLEFDCFIIIPTTKEDNISEISSIYNIIYLNS